MKYADVIVDISLEALDRVFQYLIPEEIQEKITVGSQVQVPFGRGNRTVKGYVVGFSETCDYDESRLKAIQKLSENGITVESQMIALADWMSRAYGCTRAQALKTVLNVKRQVRGGTQRVYRLTVPEAEAEAEMNRLALQPRFASRAAILALLLDDGERRGLSEKMLRKKVPSPDIWRDDRQVHLLYGVTGSGKTEVYMNLIERVIGEGKQAIVLIPEISLTYQNISRFRQRFGRRVSVMNSRMSDGERYDQYIQAKNGEIDIMIGPRSALFAPFSKLGIIIIDEEQDGAYKSDTMPKYHAIDVAIRRTAMSGGKVILGSATPSVVTYDRACRGLYGLHRLSERAADGSDMAAVEVIDLREELKQKNYSIFSRRLQEEIRQKLERKEQIMLFLNRRGYAGFISCRSCGYVVRCPHCDVSMTLHKSEGNILKCHYCGSRLTMPEKCPECGSSYIGAFGMGTQRVVEMLGKHFPQARILRADRDSMGRKNSPVEIFRTFAKGGADILVGTQMIVKGHDFPNVTLVGVLAADLSMFSGDYLAGERTFQLLTQAAGRAGRGEKQGLALIQTYQPDHYAIVCAAKQDYEAFYAQEILYRKLMNYPPAGNMMVAVVEHEDEEAAKAAAEMLAGAMKGEDVQVLSPADGFRAKEKDIYRKVIYIKSSTMKGLFRCRNTAQRMVREDGLLKQMNVQFDINPISLY